MTARSELLQLEREGWQALSSDGDAAARHYERHLADTVLMLLPGGMVIDRRQAVIDSMSGAPWDDFAITNERVLELGEDVAVVAYSAVANRSGRRYEALFNSTYVREHGAWKLTLHQQTPLDP